MQQNWLWLLCCADVFLNAVNYQIDFGIRKITTAGNGIIGHSPSIKPY